MKGIAVFAYDPMSQGILLALIGKEEPWCVLRVHLCQANVHSFGTNRRALRILAKHLLIRAVTPQDRLRQW